MQCLAHQTELQLLQVSQATVEHLRTATGGSGGEVAGLDQGDAQAARGGVQCRARAHHATADDHDIELLTAEALPGFRTLGGSKIHAVRLVEIVMGHQPTGRLDDRTRQ